MRFSHRMGIIPGKNIIQKDSIDADLLHSLWNVTYIFYLENLPGHQREINKDKKRYLDSLWINFFKQPIDEMPKICHKIVTSIKDWFFNTEWYEVYDFIDFTSGYDSNNENLGYEDTINIYLKQELSGYRLINHKLCPITSDEEIKEIQDVIDNTTTSSLSNIQAHIISALDKLSDRTSPDYRNSIKESISAVEAIARIISEDKKAELGKALKIIEDKVGLHGALKKGFLSIYGYTSDDDGIRHALIDNSNCDQEDAKYMLVSCSAFVNYLIIKANKSGINII
ncbi:MAG: hypothetical protein ISS29_07855 [Candidatus Marinimicrobia bacterium]|nr:hypothetical protein [Candidatus Neomarinimicrobiota bacterium]